VRYQLCKMYILGNIFWTYDHVPYTPGFKDFFHQAISLRNRAADFFAEGKFVDDIGIKCCSKDIIAKLFELPNDDSFLCVWNSSDTAGTITLENSTYISEIKEFTLTGDKIIKINKKLQDIECPKSELSIIVLHKKNN